MAYRLLPVSHIRSVRSRNQELSAQEAASYHRTILQRQELLSEEVSRTTAIHSTLITTFGLEYNDYSGVFDQVITLDDLFSA